MDWTKEQIRRARERKGWSQEELAEELGVSVTSVSSWERGVARPRNLAALDGVFSGVDDSPTVKAASEAELLVELLARTEARNREARSTDDNFDITLRGAQASEEERNRRKRA